jgi:hypothetical protein
MAGTNTLSTGGQGGRLMLVIPPMKLGPFPSPRELMTRWQDGTIEREEMQRLMREHHLALLEEAEDYHANPVAGYLEGLVNKRMAKRLIRDHGEAAVRELLLAMSWLPDFAPAAYLWNADHWDMGLHVFFRHKSEPVFRVRESLIKSERAVWLIEYGSSKKSRVTRERVTFRRHWKGEMEVVKRERV